jgi:Response regulators consisting of a CheY-like receiver domain and a winged-helix DNA-binding domain
MAKLSSVRSGAIVLDARANMATLVADMLRMLGWRDIREVTEAGQALLLLQRAEFELIIVDDALGGVDAVEMVRRLRADTTSPNRLTTVIMMSAAPDLKRIAAARDAGVTEFLRKPFAARDLKARLDALSTSPRPFVEAAAYAGPDRRRRNQEVGAADRRSSGETQIQPDRH